MAGDDLTTMDYAVAFEILRHFMRRELRAKDITVAELARDIGETPARLHRFLAGGRADLRLWNTLAEFVRDRPPMMPHPGMIALAALVDTLPMRLRKDARLLLASTLSVFVRQRTRRMPEWLDEELRQW